MSFAAESMERLKAAHDRLHEVILERDELLETLRAVHVETRPGVRPHSTDSYLPPHIFDRVAAAVAKHTSAQLSGTVKE